MNDNQDEQKRQLHKLLREFNANAGMAGFVCGRPVELMPAEQQSRLINGFCTDENINVLKVSRHKLHLAESLQLDPSESSKLQRALHVLDRLVATLFAAYRSSSLSLSELRTSVRELLSLPIPEDRKDLHKSLSHCIEAIQFLSEQDIDSKDDWDRVTDCAQMHDALIRTKVICKELSPQIDRAADFGKHSRKKLSDSIELIDETLVPLEGFFKGQRSHSGLKDRFVKLAGELEQTWISNSSDDV